MKGNILMGVSHEMEFLLRGVIGYNGRLDFDAIEKGFKEHFH